MASMPQNILGNVIYFVLPTCQFPQRICMLIESTTDFLLVFATRNFYTVAVVNVYFLN